ncbi:hypothetical protein NFI96_027179, partial [Prochilodus magdalenae]
MSVGCGRTVGLTGMKDTRLVSMPDGLPAAWAAVTAALVSPEVPPAVPDETVSDALALLCEQGLGQYVEGWLLETLQVRLTTNVAPQFWTGLEQPDRDLEERDRARALLEAFRTLLLHLEPFLGGLERLGSWQDEGRGGLVGPGVTAVGSVVEDGPVILVHPCHPPVLPSAGATTQSVLGVHFYSPHHIPSLCNMRPASRVFASEVGEASTGSLPADGKPIQPGGPILQRWRCHMHQFFCRIYVNMRIEELFSIIR